MKLVSIIIPVYNVGKYLRQCLDSLLAQSYPYFEAIIVDDGSTDNSGFICDEYAKKDKRFKVIHKQNEGAASARNVALELAKGDYIAFVDSDDYVDCNYLEQLINNIQDCEIVQCNERIIYKSHVENMGSIKSGKYTIDEFMTLYLKNWFCSLLHNKLFLKKTIDSIRMEEGHIVDDEYFTYKCLLNAKKIKQIDSITYNYRMRKTGAMRNINTIYRINLDRVDFLFKRYKDIKTIRGLKQLYLNDLIDQYLCILKDYYLSHEIINDIKIKFVKLFFEIKEIHRKKSVMLALLTPNILILHKKNKKSSQKLGEEYYE